MTTLNNLLSQGTGCDTQYPWPRATLDRRGWNLATESLAAGSLSLLGLWAEITTIHMAMLDIETHDIGVVSFQCQGNEYPSVGRLHPPAIRLERAIRDLFGIRPIGLDDTRGWLDHHTWGIQTPLGAVQGREPTSSPYTFYPAHGESLHQIPVGPVHAGIIEPGHFRFTANGETVVRLEERLGYTHKGIEGLMTGADLERAVSLAARTSGDSTVAYAIAFSRAVESALGTEVPKRADWLRGLMAELERLANHLGDIGAICNDAAFALMHAHCGILRERVLRASGSCFGHRLIRDRVVPGGTTVDIDQSQRNIIAGLIQDIRRYFPALVELYDNTASLQERTVTTGILSSVLAQQYAAGGYVGRGSGRDFDARRKPGYPPYDDLDFETPVREEGDVNARVWVRILEVEQSLLLVEQILERLPPGEIRNTLPCRSGEGMALVEGFRGDILAWVRLDAQAKVSRCSLRDPSWFQWPLLEAAIEGNIVADFPLCNKSFNCSYSGHDL